MSVHHDREKLNHIAYLPDNRRCLGAAVAALRLGAAGAALRLGAVAEHNNSYAKIHEIGVDARLSERCANGLGLGKFSAGGTRMLKSTTIPLVRRRRLRAGASEM